MLPQSKSCANVQLDPPSVEWPFSSLDGKDPCAGSVDPGCVRNHEYYYSDIRDGNHSSCFYSGLLNSYDCCVASEPYAPGGPETWCCQQVCP